MGAHIPVPVYQRSLAQRYLLVGWKCEECGAVTFPPKGVCMGCLRSTRFSPVRMSGRGELYSYTVIAGGGAPPEFSGQARAKGRYVVGLVQLAEGPRVIAQVVDVEPDEVHVGMPLRVVLRRIYEEEGVVRYGFKFRPDSA